MVGFFFGCVVFRFRHLDRSYYWAYGLVLWIWVRLFSSFALGWCLAGRLVAFLFEVLVSIVIITGGWLLLACYFSSVLCCLLGRVIKDQGI